MTLYVGNCRLDARGRLYSALFESRSEMNCKSRQQRGRASTLAITICTLLCGRYNGLCSTSYVKTRSEMHHFALANRPQCTVRVRLTLLLPHHRRAVSPVKSSSKWPIMCRVGLTQSLTRCIGFIIIIIIIKGKCDRLPQHLWLRLDAVAVTPRLVQCLKPAALC